jgi:hypothetical protein
LYFPLINFLFPSDLWNVGVCEVTGWYDPAETFPERVTLCADLSLVTPAIFGVHIWNGRKDYTGGKYVEPLTLGE